MKILNVYKWATMGGVERVLLNRAHAIKKFGFGSGNIKFDVFFLHDSGGKQGFINYVYNNGLQNIVRIVDKVIDKQYDLIFSIDTPDILDLVDVTKTYIECHTSYVKNREYLKHLPPNIRGILVPSDHFREEIINEIPKHLKTKLNVLTNYVYVSPTVEKLTNRRIFSKIPIIYIGRIDRLKNVEEIVRVVSAFNESYSDRLILILAGAIIEHEVDLNKILKLHGMESRTIYLPPINFEKVWSLLLLVKEHNGVFMSASFQESFGLSVAEAMRCGLPVLLLDNVAHRNLVNNDESFLFKPNSINETASKLSLILENYKHYVDTIVNYSMLLERKFVMNWKQLLQHKEKEFE